MIKLKLKKNAQKIDNFLKNFLNKQKNTMLLTPMKYGVISGGKKIRSTIIFDIGRLLKVKEKNKLEKKEILIMHEAEDYPTEWIQKMLQEF